MRVFLGLTEIAGNYSRLQRGFVSIGVPCTFMHLHGHAFAYQSAAARGLLIRFHREAALARVATPRSKLLRKATSIALERGLHGAMFLDAMLTHDAFVFSFGKTFYEELDLQLLKLMGKRVICVFHGTDSRPPYIGGVTALDGPDGTSGRALADETLALRKRLRRIERYADVIVSNPLSAHLFERPVVSSLALGKSLALVDAGSDAGEAPRRRQPGDRIRIVHAPSRPRIKGTALIRAAVETLRGEGLPLDYVEIAGKPNGEVLAELERCDFVIDQLYSDLPMSTSSAEAGYFYKPSIVAGYAWSEIERCCSPEHLPPVHYCAPEQLLSAIRRMAVDDAFRMDLGRRAGDFVRRRFSGAEAARRYLRLIEGDIPQDWLFAPADIRYVQGCGLSEDAARAAVRRVLAYGGARALGLSTKPELERLFLEFAQEPEGTRASPA